MTARKVVIAEALASALSEAPSQELVSQPITVTRTWIQIEKKDISLQPPFSAANVVAGSIQVYIMAGEEQPSDFGDTRGIVMVDYPIQVGIAAYLATRTIADIDPLAQVSEEIRDYCRLLSDPTPLATLDIPEQVIGMPEIICDPDEQSIKSDKLFLSLFTLTFRGGRTR